MKKYILIITVSMILVVIFSIISSIQEQSSNSYSLLNIASPKSNPDFENFVELEVVREDNSQREFSVVINNSSEEEIISGNLYLVDGEWKSIPSEVAFTDVGIPISPQSFRLFNVNLTIDYPNDFTGLFRIRTTIHSDGDLMTSHDLTAEFVLE